MVKKFFLSILVMLSCMAVVTSCGDDADDNQSSQQQVIKTRMASVSEGTEIDAKSIDKITVSYNNLVRVAENANITLNGVKVQAQKGSRTEMEIEIPVSLEMGTEYTLIIPSGAVVLADNPNMTAPAYTLHFKTQKSAEASIPDNGAKAVTDMLGFGWNLGNHFDSLGEEKDNYRITWSKDCPYWDGVNPTEELYKNLAKAGVNTVRIPVTWGPYEGAAPDYVIESAYMDVVKKNVLWAKNAGLKVVLNTHHDEYWQDAFAAGGNEQTNKDIKTRIEATWRQIAEAFREEGDYLILESFNELNHNWANPNSSELRIMNEWNQLVVNTIRNTGGNNATRWIAVPSYQASPSHALSDAFVLPEDKANKLIVAVHCYDPYNFTLAKSLTETWGHTLGGANDEKAITDLLNKLRVKFIEKDIPCYLGEFGCSRHETEKGNRCRDYYLEYFCRAAHFAGIAVTLWDNFAPGMGSEHHAYFSHKDGSWADGSEGIVKTMIKAATSKDASYTLESIYNRAPKN